MTTLVLILGTFSVSALVGLAVLLLTYPRPQLHLGARQAPAWAAFLGKGLRQPLAGSGVVVSWKARLVIGGASALPLAALGTYLRLPWLLLPALAAFLAAPEIFAAHLSARRDAKKEAQVPLALEALCRALRRGANLYHSLAEAAREVGPPLGEDLQRALDGFAVAGDMASALDGLRQEAASRRLGRLLDVLIFDLAEGVAGTPGEVERLESLLEGIAQEEAVRRELATKTAGARFNLRLISLTIPGTMLLVVATDSSLLAPLLFHPLGNLSLGLSAIAYIGTLYLSHRWSRVEL